MFSKIDVLKNFAKCTKGPVSGSLLFWTVTFFKKETPAQVYLLQRLSTKKYFKIKCLYITIYMFHVLLSRASVCLCMCGFQKEKFSKKLRDQKKAAQKVEVFVQNMFFRQFLVYEKIIYFSESVFPDVTGNILEEYVDLIVTQDSTDHFASHETIEGSKQVFIAITCFYQNF